MKIQISVQFNVQSMYTKYHYSLLRNLIILSEKIFNLANFNLFLKIFLFFHPPHLQARQWQEVVNDPRFEVRYKYFNTFKQLFLGKTAALFRKSRNSIETYISEQRFFLICLPMKFLLESELQNFYMQARF